MKKCKILLYFLPAILLTSAIFWFSSKDIETSNAQSGQVTEKVAVMLGSNEEDIASNSTPLMPLDILNLYVRSLAHVAEFGALGLLIILGCMGAKFPAKQLFHITWIWGVATALTDEIIQYFTPGRTCDIGDITKDIIGIFLALLFSYILVKIYTIYRQRKSIAYDPS